MFFDILPLRHCLNLSQQLISKLDHSKSDMFATATIEDFLLGPEDGSGMTDAFDELKYYDELQKWKSDDWRTLGSQVSLVSVISLYTPIYLIDSFFYPVLDHLLSTIKRSLVMIFLGVGRTKLWTSMAFGLVIRM